MLGILDVEFVAGNARDGWSHHDYCNGMHIYYGGRDDTGVELSGSGCRMLETCNGDFFDWIGLFDELVYHGNDINISRLDVAGDDKDEILSMKKLVQYTSSHKYICKARRCVWIDGDEQEILYGASSSSTRLRIYNKALERGVDEPWIRAEFQLRDKAADSFIANLLQMRDIGKVYGGVLLNYLRYTVSVPAESNNHYDLIDTVSWWSKFVCTAQKIKNVKVGGLEYNYFNLESYLVKQVSSSLKAYVEANNGSIDELMKIINEARLSKKQKEMLSQLNCKEKI